MNLIKKNIPAAIIIIFHVVGFAGFLINPSYFKSLTPVNLMLSAGLVLLMSNQTKWQFYGAIAAVGVIGFFVELVGVKTGAIFGHYVYGHALGYQLWAVPLLIGLNWAVLVYSTLQMPAFKNTAVNALWGAVLMVGLDYFIEQNAQKFDFWYWKGGHIPLQNYIAWFVVSFGLNRLFQKYLIQKPNPTARVFYITQLVFFIALYLFA